MDSWELDSLIEMDSFLGNTRQFFQGLPSSTRGYGHSAPRDESHAPPTPTPPATPTLPPAHPYHPYPQPMTGAVPATSVPGLLPPSRPMTPVTPSHKPPDHGTSASSYNIPFLHPTSTKHSPADARFLQLEHYRQGSLPAGPIVAPSSTRSQSHNNDQGLTVESRMSSRICAKPSSLPGEGRSHMPVHSTQALGTDLRHSRIYNSTQPLPNDVRMFPHSYSSQNSSDSRVAATATATASAIAPPPPPHSDSKYFPRPEPRPPDLRIPEARDRRADPHHEHWGPYGTPHTKSFERLAPSVHIAEASVSVNGSKDTRYLGKKSEESANVSRAENSLFRKSIESLQVNGSRDSLYPNGSHSIHSIETKRDSSSGLKIDNRPKEDSALDLSVKTVRQTFDSSALSVEKSHSQSPHITTPLVEKSSKDPQRRTPSSSVPVSSPYSRTPSRDASPLQLSELIKNAPGISGTSKGTSPSHFHQYSVTVSPRPVESPNLLTQPLHMLPPTKRTGDPPYYDHVSKYARVSLNPSNKAPPSSADHALDRSLMSAHKDTLMDQSRGLPLYVASSASKELDIRDIGESKIEKRPLHPDARDHSVDWREKRDLSSERRDLSISIERRNPTLDIRDSSLERRDLINESRDFSFTRKNTAPEGKGKDSNYDKRDTLTIEPKYPYGNHPAASVDPYRTWVMNNDHSKYNSVSIDRQKYVPGSQPVPTSVPTSSPHPNSRVPSAQLNSSYQHPPDTRLPQTPHTSQASHTAASARAPSQGSSAQSTPAKIHQPYMQQSHSNSSSSSGSGSSSSSSNSSSSSSRTSQIPSTHGSSHPSHSLGTAGPLNSASQPHYPYPYNPAIAAHYAQHQQQHPRQARPPSAYPPFSLPQSTKSSSLPPPALTTQHVHQPYLYPQHRSDPSLSLYPNKRSNQLSPHPSGSPHPSISPHPSASPNTAASPHPAASPHHMIASPRSVVSPHVAQQSRIPQYSPHSAQRSPSASSMQHSYPGSLPPSPYSGHQSHVSHTTPPSSRPSSATSQYSLSSQTTTASSHPQPSPYPSSAHSQSPVNPPQSITSHLSQTFSVSSQSQSPHPSQGPPTHSSQTHTGSHPQPPVSHSLQLSTTAVSSVQSQYSHASHPPVTHHTQASISCQAHPTWVTPPYAGHMTKITEGSASQPHPSQSYPPQGYSHQSYTAKTPSQSRSAHPPASPQHHTPHPPSQARSPRPSQAHPAQQPSSQSQPTHPSQGPAPQTQQPSQAHTLQPHPSQQPHPPLSQAHPAHPSRSQANPPHPSTSPAHPPHPSPSSAHAPHPSRSPAHPPHPSPSPAHSAHPSRSPAHPPRPSPSPAHTAHPSPSPAHPAHPSPSPAHPAHPSPSPAHPAHPSSSAHPPHPSPALAHPSSSAHPPLPSPVHPSHPPQAHPSQQLHTSQPSQSQPPHPSQAQPLRPSHAHPPQPSQAHLPHPSQTQPPHPSQAYPPHPSQAHPTHSSQAHPLHPSQAHPPHSSQGPPPHPSHPLHPSQAHLPHLSLAHPPHPSQAHPPHPSQAHPPHPSQAHPPHPSQAHPPHPSQAHPLHQSHPSRAHPPHPSQGHPPHSSQGHLPHPSQTHPPHPSQAPPPHPSQAPPPHPSQAHHPHPSQAHHPHPSQTHATPTSPQYPPPPQSQPSHPGQPQPPHATQAQLPHSSQAQPRSSSVHPQQDPSRQSSQAHPHPSHPPLSQQSQDHPSHPSHVYASHPYPPHGHNSHVQPPSVGTSHSHPPQTHHMQGHHQPHSPRGLPLQSQVQSHPQSHSPRGHPSQSVSPRGIASHAHPVSGHPHGYPPQEYPSPSHPPHDSSLQTYSLHDHSSQSHPLMRLPYPSSVRSQTIHPHQSSDPYGMHPHVPHPTSGHHAESLQQHPHPGYPPPGHHPYYPPHQQYPHPPIKTETLACSSQYSAYPYQSHASGKLESLPPNRAQPGNLAQPPPGALSSPRPPQDFDPSRIRTKGEQKSFDPRNAESGNSDCKSEAQSGYQPNHQKINSLPVADDTKDQAGGTKPDVEGLKLSNLEGDQKVPVIGKEEGKAEVVQSANKTLEPGKAALAVKLHKKLQHAESMESLETKRENIPENVVPKKEEKEEDEWDKGFDKLMEDLASNPDSVTSKKCRNLGRKYLHKVQIQNAIDNDLIVPPSAPVEEEEDDSEPEAPVKFRGKFKSIKDKKVERLILTYASHSDESALDMIPDEDASDFEEELKREIRLKSKKRGRDKKKVTGDSSSGSEAEKVGRKRSGGRGTNKENKPNNKQDSDFSFSTSNTSSESSDSDSSDGSDTEDSDLEELVRPGRKGKKSDNERRKLRKKWDSDSSDSEEEVLPPRRPRRGHKYSSDDDSFKPLQRSKKRRKKQDSSESDEIPIKTSRRKRRSDSEEDEEVITRGGKKKGSSNKKFKKTSKEDSDEDSERETPRKTRGMKKKIQELKKGKRKKQMPMVSSDSEEITDKKDEKIDCRKKRGKIKAKSIEEDSSDSDIPTKKKSSPKSNVIVDSDESDSNSRNDTSKAKISEKKEPSVEEPILDEEKGESIKKEAKEEADVQEVEENLLDIDDDDNDANKEPDSVIEKLNKIREEELNREDVQEMKAWLGEVNREIEKQLVKFQDLTLRNNWKKPQFGGGEDFLHGWQNEVKKYKEQTGRFPKKLCHAAKHQATSTPSKSSPRKAKDQDQAKDSPKRGSSSPAKNTRSKSGIIKTKIDVAEDTRLKVAARPEISSVMQRFFDKVMAETGGDSVKEESSCRKFTLGPFPAYGSQRVPTGLTPTPSVAPSMMASDDSDLDSLASLRMDLPASDSVTVSKRSIANSLLKKIGRKYNVKKLNTLYLNKTRDILEVSNKPQLLPTPGIPASEKDLEEMSPEQLRVATFFRKETVDNYRRNFEGIIIKNGINDFTPILYESRTRNKTKQIQDAATIKSVFGFDIPPHILKKNEGKKGKKVIKKVEKDKKEEPRKEESCTSTPIGSVLAAGEEDDDSELRSERSESVLGESSVSHVPKRVRRKFRKFRSGFDYIRKKKKVKADDEAAPSRKRFPVRKHVNWPEQSRDVASEVRAWVVNKGLGETVLHKAARLQYHVTAIRSPLGLCSKPSGFSYAEPSGSRNDGNIEPSGSRDRGTSIPHYADPSGSRNISYAEPLGSLTDTSVLGDKETSVSRYAEPSGSCNISYVEPLSSRNFSHNDTSVFSDRETSVSRCADPSGSRNTVHADLSGSRDLSHSFYDREFPNSRCVDRSCSHNTSYREPSGERSSEFSHQPENSREHGQIGAHDRIGMHDRLGAHNRLGAHDRLGAHNRLGAH
ncbi:uncharacterized protein [Palaemon carinicauda]|uniref:uncharacterized protein n=1 Tax=Palaemon carinicauda TaxID=392227 RepID=UPI0035B57419